MKIRILAGVGVAAFFAAGCGQKDAATGNGSPPAATANASTNAAAATPAAPTSQATVSVGTPVMQPILAVWQEGNHAQAVSLFAEANWNGRPTFPPGMTLSMTEAQFAALSDADRQLRFGELTAQLDLVKHLAASVSQAGRDAAAKGDNEQAKKFLASLQNCGAALDTPERLKLVRMVGKTMKEMGSNELAKMAH